MSRKKTSTLRMTRFNSKFRKEYKSNIYPGVRLSIMGIL